MYYSFRGQLKNKSGDTVVYPKGSAEWKANKGWRSANNGDITKASLIAYYNSKGYRDARIISDSIYNADANANEINIKINVEEGNRYYFGDIKWSGNFVYNDDILDQVWDMCKYSI